MSWKDELQSVEDKQREIMDNAIFNTTPLVVMATVVYGNQKSKDAQVAITQAKKLLEALEEELSDGSD